MESTQLTKHSGFKAELAIAESIEEIELIEAKAAAVAEFAKKDKIARDEQNEWGRFRIEIKAKKGKLLEDKFPHGAKKGTNNKQVLSSTDTNLEKAGITPDESSLSRVIYNEPELVQEVMDEIEEEDKVITPNLVATRVRNKLIEIQPSNSIFNETNENIEWAKWSWNPITGCNQGCKYCYARDIANRYYTEYKFEPHFYPDRLLAPKNTKIPIKHKNESGWNNVFVCSMSDLLGEWIPVEWIDTIIDVIEKSPEWNYLLLTKNPRRYLEFKWPINTWLGATADTQKRATDALDIFKQIEHPVKFLSCEPLEEKIILTDNPSFNWLIIGGRSESSGMPASQPKWEWVESLINQARKHKIKIYGKPNLKVLPKEYPK